MDNQQTATTIQLLGSGGFGALMGWYVYYTNRYRKEDVKLSDLVTLICVLGGAGILALFPARSDLFGSYGIGLFIGFFGYFFALLLFVAVSKNFTLDWFLDGRRVPRGSLQNRPVGVTSSQQLGGIAVTPRGPGWLWT